MHVFGLLAAVGMTLALMFVAALNWQRNALQVGQTEVELRSALDQTTDERRQLQVEQQRALSPRETDLRSRQAGLAPIKLDERMYYLRPAPKPAAKAGKPKASTAQGRQPAASAQRR
jgi:hypothetical protein